MSISSKYYQVPVQSSSEPEFGGIVISESCERLVQLVETSWLAVSPAYFERGFQHAKSAVYVRTGVAMKLKQAAERLPDGIKLLAWDGVRSLQLQAEIADRFRLDLAKKGLSAAEKKRLVTQFVSPLPSSFAEFHHTPPAHTTGGAIDLTLCDGTGKPLDMGTEFDDFSEKSRPDWYERNGTIDDEKPRVLRRLLTNIMNTVGGVQYHTEWWHFEFGTIRACAYKGHNVAPYGPIVPADGIGRL